MRSKEEQLKAKLDQERKKNEELKREIESAQQGREPSVRSYLQCIIDHMENTHADILYQDERDKILLELKELQAENKALVSEMQLYKDNDPETYKAKGKKKKWFPHYHSWQ